MGNSLQSLRDEAADLYTNYLWWDQRVATDGDEVLYDLEDKRRAWKLYEAAERKIADFLNEEVADEVRNRT